MSLRNHIDEIDEIGRMFERWGLAEHFTETVKDSLFLYQGARVKDIEVGSDVFEICVLRDAPDQPEPREFQVYIGLNGGEYTVIGSGKRLRHPTALTAWEVALRVVVRVGSQ